MIKKRYTALYTDNFLLFFDEDCGDVAFGFNGICILDNNFGEDGPDTIVFIRLLAWHSKFKKHKALKKKISEELMPIA